MTRSAAATLARSGEGVAETPGTFGRARQPSLSALVGLLTVVAGAYIGLRPLADNSLLTHLATGRLILDDGAVPNADPYTFTAAGEPWVVQSWLASVLYAVAENLGGLSGVLVLVGATTAALTGLAWLLSRPAETLVPRLVLVVLFLSVGASSWSGRPLMFALVALSVSLLAAEGRVDARWLLVVGWLWANLHGSYPLGLVALALLAIGRRLDRQPADDEVRATVWLAGGLLLGVVGPLGLKVLTFPVHLLSRQEVLSHIHEWQSPEFVEVGERAYLVLVLVAVVALMRRPSWRAALPLLVFVPASLLAARNIVFAVVVLLPGTARGLAAIGTIDGGQRRPSHRLVGAALVAALAGLLVAGSQWRAFHLDAYPEEAVTWLDEHHLIGRDRRVVTPDFVGNYLEARFGTHTSTFVDDRYDMFPVDFVDQYVKLNNGGEGWDEVLTDIGPDAVLWPGDTPLGQLLEASSDWRIVYRDDDYLVARPRT